MKRLSLTSKTLLGWLLALVVLLAACVPTDPVDKDQDALEVRSAPSTFDLNIENPDIDILNKTVMATISFDVLGRQTAVSGSGIAVKIAGQFFLLTAHHTFRGAGVENAVATAIGVEGVPRISCFRQHLRELCPTGSMVLLALPDKDIALLGPLENPPAQQYITLDDNRLQRTDLRKGQLMFSWGYPYGYGPSFNRSRLAYIQTGPLYRGGASLGSGKDVDTLYLKGWVSPGDSGGPLFAFDGAFAGILNGGGSDTGSGTGYATVIPAWEFIPELTELIEAASRAP